MLICVGNGNILLLRIIFTIIIAFINITAGFLGGLAAAASDSAYSYTFLRSVVCPSVCLSSVTFVHPA